MAFLQRSRRRNVGYFVAFLVTAVLSVLTQQLRQLSGHLQQLVMTRRSTSIVEESSLVSTLLSPSQPSDVPQNEPTTRHLPSLILHVGPPKTATTFLQSSLCTQHATDLLDRDGYKFLGIFPTSCARGRPRYQAQPFVGHRKSDWFTSEENNNATVASLGSRFAKALDEAEEAQQHILVINEDFSYLSEEPLEVLAERVRGRFQVQVLVAYRRIYQWLPSKYNQMHRPSKARYVANSWPETATLDLEDNATTLSLDDVATHVLPFDLDHRGRFSKVVHGIERTGEHPIGKVLRRYQQFFNVTTIDLHNLEEEDNKSFNNSTTGDPYLQHLFCRVLQPFPYHCCTSAVTGELGRGSRSNPSQSTTYEYLAVRAWQWGLLESNKDGHSTSVSRPFVVRVIRNYHEKRLNLTLDDFPVTCLDSSTLDRLLNLSLAVEVALFSNDRDRDQSYHEAQHRADFDKDVSEQKFCHVDADRVLQDDGWRNLLLSLAGGGLTNGHKPKDGDLSLSKTLTEYFKDALKSKEE